MTCGASIQFFGKENCCKFNLRRLPARAPLLFWWYLFDCMRTYFAKNAEYVYIIIYFWVTDTKSKLVEHGYITNIVIICTTSTNFNKFNKFSYHVSGKTHKLLSINTNCSSSFSVTVHYLSVYLWTVFFVTFSELQGGIVRASSSHNSSQLTLSALAGAYLEIICGQILCKLFSECQMTNLRGNIFDILTKIYFRVQ